MSFHVSHERRSKFERLNYRIDKYEKARSFFLEIYTSGIPVSPTKPLTPLSHLDTTSTLSCAAGSS